MVTDGNQGASAGDSKPFMTDSEELDQVVVTDGNRGESDGGDSEPFINVGKNQTRPSIVNDDNWCEAIKVVKNFSS